VHWGNVRVWNDDTIQSQTRFSRHPHSEIETITYVCKGAMIRMLD